MPFDLRQHAYAGWLIGLCVLVTIGASADDDENAWMVVAAAAACSVILIAPEGLDRPRQVRNGPQGLGLGVLALLVAILAGALESPPETFAGLEATLILGFVAGSVLIGRSSKRL